MALVAQGLFSQAFFIPRLGLVIFSFARGGCCGAGRDPVENVFGFGAFLNYDLRFTIYEVMSENTTTLKKVEKGKELALSLDAAAEELKDAWLTEGNFARTFAYGMAVAKMREVLTPQVMQSLVKLKNSKLGFRTDESKGNEYPIEVVRDCVIDAATLGLQCVGNQFNIIGGNMYVTKEGFTYLLRELVRAGLLKDMKFVYSTAEISESSTQGTRRDGSSYQKIEREGRIKVDVRWVFDGKPGHEELEFCVRVNAGMSQDAIVGKAERKAKAWLYNFLTDQAVSDGEAEVAAGEVREVKARAVDAPGFLQRAEESGPVALPGAGFKPNWARQEAEDSAAPDGVVADGAEFQDEIPGLGEVC